MERKVRIDLGPRSYDVRIGPGLLGQAGLAAGELPSARRATVIADRTVADLYSRGLLKSLGSAGIEAQCLEFPAGEQNKTLSTFSHLMDGLFSISPPIDRDHVIVALGGGVTGDLAGFVAACALRGLRWIQCPTTLLADVDASVGGKTAVDHQAGKNLIGAFHQPSAVVIDVSVLSTLPQCQISNGLAECVKHALIADQAGLDFLEQNAQTLLQAQKDVMTELIAHDVSIKASIVSADEREAGLRAKLNFGHTIGHAIELAVGLGELLHGQAVSLGMVAASRLSHGRGLIDQHLVERIERLLDRLALPTSHIGLDSRRIWAIMQHDKKARSGRIRMVLPVGPGKVGIFDDLQEPEIIRAVESLGG